MLKKMIFLFLLMSIILAKEPIAFIANIEGESESLCRFMPLYQDENIDIAEGIKLTVLYSNGERKLLKGPMTYHITLQDKIADEDFSRLWPIMEDILENAFYEARIETLRSSRGGRGIASPGEIISPDYSQIDKLHPEIRWSRDHTINSQKIEIYEKDSLIFTEDIDTSSSYRFPDSLNILDWGHRYRLILISYSGLNIQVYDTTEFQVISKIELERIRQATFGMNDEFVDNNSFTLFTRAVFFDEFGIRPLALYYFQKFVAECDYSPDSVLILAEYYKRIGYDKLAIETLYTISDIPEKIIEKWNK